MLFQCLDQRFDFAGIVPAERAVAAIDDDKVAPGSVAGSFAVGDGLPRDRTGFSQRDTACVREHVNDGVSAVVAGSNDWAGAWAVDAGLRPLLPVIPGGEAQRELAYRTGVNLVMYVLTGNYKADQVHVPALLERLGQ